MSEKLNNTNFVFTVVIFSVILFAVLSFVNQRISNEVDDSLSAPAVVRTQPQKEENKFGDMRPKSADMVSSVNSGDTNAGETVDKKSADRQEEDVMRIQEPPLDSVILIQ